MANNKIENIAYEYTSVDSKTNSLMVQYKKAYGAPFDVSSVFESAEGLENFAKGNLSHAGQITSVVNSAKTDVYKINYNSGIEKLLSEADLGEYYTKTEANNAFDVAGAAASALTEAKNYASGLSVNYDVAGAAASALTEAKDYVDSKVLSLDGYATSADVITTKEIIPKGGVWADEVFSVFNGNVPSGLTFQEFLEKMICIEKFATNIKTETTLLVTCSNPDVGLSNQDYEIGTSLTLKKVKFTEPKISHNIKTTGLDYGYKIGENGSYISSTEYVQNLSARTTNENILLKETFTGFTNENGTLISTVTGTSELEAMVIYVGSGTNKVVIAQSGNTYSSNTSASVDNIYVATNMGNYYKKDSKELNIYTPTVSNKSQRATSSIEYTINGYRNTFYGTTMGSEELTADFVRSGLTPTNKTIKSGDSITLNTFKADNHKRMIIASPIKITSVTDDMKQQIITGDLVNSITTLTIPGANGKQPIIYNIYDYTWVAPFDNKTWIITF